MAGASGEIVGAPAEPHIAERLESWNVTSLDGGSSIERIGATAVRFSRRKAMKLIRLSAGLMLLMSFVSCTGQREYDVILRNGMIYDGSGSPPVTGDLAITGDTIAEMGPLSGARGKAEIDVAGMAVAPGFVNMMCWANESLIEDGRSQSDIRQGVTLEVLGEGDSMGPLNEAMKAAMVKDQGDIKYEVTWNTLGEYMEYLEKRGVSPNVASFIGAATPRVYVIGYDDRPPTPDELERMRELVRQAMKEGAMGVASSLIYPPGSFAKTPELVALASVAAENGGMYITHLRSEGSGILDALDELLAIARQAGIRGEIYHLKVSGKSNWPKAVQVIEKVERARSEGLQITADVYTYPAGSTGLNSTMPPWVQDGGFAESLKRMRDPRRGSESPGKCSRSPTSGRTCTWARDRPDNVLLVGFRTEKLKPYTGKTLAEVARLRGKSPEETAMDLIVEDESRIETVYFTQSEENLRKNPGPPVGQFLLRLPLNCSGGGFSEEQCTPEGLRQLCPAPGQVRARAEDTEAGGSDPEACGAALAEPQG